MMQVQMPKFAKVSSDLSVYTKKIIGGRGSAPVPVVTAVCLIFKHCWRTSGVLESPGIF